MKTNIRLTRLVCLVLVFAFSLWIGMWCIVTMEAERQCAELGWKSSIATWDLGRYCYRQVGGTDLVLPLRDIEAGRQTICTEPLDE